MVLKQHILGGVICLRSQYLSGRKAHGQNNHFKKAEDVSRAKSLGVVSWQKAGSKSQENFFQRDPMASVGGDDHPDQQVLSKREPGKRISVGNANGAELGTTSKWSWKDGEFMANTSGRARNITKVQLQLHLS